MSTVDGYGMPRNKLVVDWHNRPVGRVCDARVDPRTRGVRAIVVALSGEAQGPLARGAARPPATEVVIPVGMVHSIRAAEVVLDRPLEALRGLAAGAPGQAAAARRAA